MPGRQCRLTDSGGHNPEVSMKRTVILSGLVFICSIAPAFAAQTVKPELFKQWLESGKAMVIVDIQPADDFEEQHFKGAIETNAFPAKTDEEKKRLDKALGKIQTTRDAVVVIVCPRGKTGASNAYEYLKARGVSENRLAILEGGIAYWPWPALFVTGR